MKLNSASLGLAPFALTAITITGLYTAAESLCSAFVGLYLLKNSGDLKTVLLHYLALYGSLPIFFVFAGWYAQAHDKLHVYRLGIMLHTVYYALLLYLQNRAPDHAVELGLLMGLTWGMFYAAANTIHFDVSSNGRRGYYLGLLTSVNGFFQLAAPLVSGIVIHLFPERNVGYEIIFTFAIALYCACFLITFRLPNDRVGKPFRFPAAVFPKRQQRDWRMALLSATLQLGIDVVMVITMPLLMFLETSSEFSVGGFASFQALAFIIVAFFVGRSISTSWRKRYMLIGAIATLAGGIVLAIDIRLATIVFYGFMRAIGEPMFGIPQSTIRWNIISSTITGPAERIPYLCAFEVSLGLGRVLALAPIVIAFYFYPTSPAIIGIALLILGIARFGVMFVLNSTNEVKNA